jgi:hypothetical protein
MNEINVTPQVLTVATAFENVKAKMDSVLHVARQQAGADESAYGANRKFAASLNDLAYTLSPDFKWYTLDKRNLGKVSKEFGTLVKGFWEAYTEARSTPTKAFENMSKIWKDIRRYGLEDAQERAMFGETMPEPEELEDGETETETTGGTQKRNPDTFIREELVEAYKRLLRDDADCSDAAKVFRGDLLAALKRFGVTGLEG